VGVVVQRLLKFVKDRKHEDALAAREVECLDYLVRSLYDWLHVEGRKRRFNTRCCLVDKSPNMMGLLEFTLTEFRHHPDNRKWIVDRDPKYPTCVRLSYVREDGKIHDGYRMKIHEISLRDLKGAINQSVPNYEKTMREEIAKREAEQTTKRLATYKQAIADLKTWLESHSHHLAVITGGPPDGMSLNFNLKLWSSRVWFVEPKPDDDQHEIIHLGKFSLRGEKEHLGAFITEPGINALKTKIFAQMREHITECERTSSFNLVRDSFFEVLSKALTKDGFVTKKDVNVLHVWLGPLDRDQHKISWRIVDREGDVLVELFGRPKKELGRFQRTEAMIPHIVKAMQQCEKSLGAPEFLTQLWSQLRRSMKDVSQPTLDPNTAEHILTRPHNTWHIHEKNDMIVARSNTWEYWSQTSCQCLFRLRDMILADEVEVGPVKWLAYIHRGLVEQGCTVHRQFEVGQLSKLSLACEPNELSITLDKDGKIFRAGFVFPNPWDWYAELGQAEADRFIETVTEWNQLTAIFNDLKKSGLNVQRPSHTKLLLTTSHGEISLGTYGVKSEVLRLDGGIVQNYLNIPASVPKICSIIKSLAARHNDPVGDAMSALVKRLQEHLLPVQTQSGIDGRLGIVVVEKRGSQSRGPAAWRVFRGIGAATGKNHHGDYLPSPGQLP
jgi:hypothetical protein